MTEEAREALDQPTSVTQAATDGGDLQTEYVHSQSCCEKAELMGPLAEIN